MDRPRSPGQPEVSNDANHDAGRDMGDGEDDDRPLLGGPRKQVEDDDQREGSASMVSGIGNLLNTIVGTGMLSFPLVGHIRLQSYEISHPIFS